MTYSLNSEKKTPGKPKDARRPSASKKENAGKGKKLYDQIIFRDWCKACGICSAFCPKQIIGRDESGAPVFQRPDECIGCRFCELHCPDFAVTIRERPAGAEKK